jgi:hypothetical protein
LRFRPDFLFEVGFGCVFVFCGEEDQFLDSLYYLSCSTGYGSACTKLCLRIVLGFSNSISRADSFFIASYVVLAKLEERCVGFDLGHRQSSIEEF